MKNPEAKVLRPALFCSTGWAAFPVRLVVTGGFIQMKMAWLLVRVHKLTGLSLSFQAGALLVEALRGPSMPGPYHWRSQATPTTTVTT